MQFFSSNGVRIAYIDVPAAGNDRNQPIVLVHGFASNHAVNWVFPQWVKTLTQDGRRVIALDNRGHGESEKLYDPAAYSRAMMAGDVVNLMDHLGLPQADVMGYSMGARITAHLAHDHPERVSRAVFGGLGLNLVQGGALPQGVADALEAPTGEGLTDPMQKMFRRFAEATKSDLRALAACMRGTRQSMSEQDMAEITCPVLVAVGTKDDVSGDGPALARMLPQGQSLAIPDRDHNLAVGDKTYKQGVLAFLA
ncbi:MULTISPECIES: alpha/beta hydrolase [unclassified Beijerinckia]|uniref:alpha/beta fold hydrolase n=1 Tax=unclassified Beijerinckia TaxID=2638183 RepID=UPI0008967746|nr:MULTISPECIES: alpha/beta hydrolase [unclassified Beijerinckia]MDH7799886.1 pimeloyl-ACP methyl ester carboxylesterase [Beijerinckia sp. GAS462]SED41131.1 Pimeloyl-ACP methyl ester carboxylesterase [Beijerinckia sp. 28-YEA-48]